MGAALAQVDIFGFVSNGIGITKDFERNIKTNAFGGRFAAANLVGQTRQCGKPFGGDVIFVSKEINKRVFDNGFRPLKRSFVEVDGFIVATYPQNALHKVDIGNEAELTLNFYPGQIYKAKVHSIVRSTGAGQLPLSGGLPQSLPQVGEGRLVVRFELEGEDAKVDVPGGTQGRAAIYTEHLKLIELVRKVIMRFEAKFDYIVFELHIPGHG